MVVNDVSVGGAEARPELVEGKTFMVVLRPGLKSRARVTTPTQVG
jgi:hypothetical protein